MMKWDLPQRQMHNVAAITFWSQFASYTYNTVLILFLTRPALLHGLDFTEKNAYAFYGVYTAFIYLTLLAGGSIADKLLGIRRAVLVGSVILAIAFFFVFLSGFTLQYGKHLFLIAFAFVPVCGSILNGAASALVARIFSESPLRIKAGMTLYYMAINVGSLLATIFSPMLMNNKYGPFMIFGLVVVGKGLSALNFAKRYELYQNVMDAVDKTPMTAKRWILLLIYIFLFFFLTYMAFNAVFLASYLIILGCTLSVLWFIGKTLTLEGEAKFKQLIAVILIIEAVVFFILYNQMNTSIVLFAGNNSDLNLLGFKVNPAQFMMFNPISIIILGLTSPYFYKAFPKFKIPYQFSAGVIIGGIGLLVAYMATLFANHGLINGNWFILIYFILAVAEMWVSAIGLSMIGLYCDKQMMGFAMGAWYISTALSNPITGLLNQMIAIPENLKGVASLSLYQHYYLGMGVAAIIIGIGMYFVANWIFKMADQRQIELH
jgi:POT family proton-dependent oligopeptide transporter